MFDGWFGGLVYFFTFGMLFNWELFLFVFYLLCLGWIYPKFLLFFMLYFYILD